MTLTRPERHLPRDAPGRPQPHFGSEPFPQYRPARSTQWLYENEAHCGRLILAPSMRLYLSRKDHRSRQCAYPIEMRYFNLGEALRFDRLSDRSPYPNVGVTPLHVVKMLMLHEPNAYGSLCPDRVNVIRMLDGGHVAVVAVAVPAVTGWKRRVWKVHHVAKADDLERPEYPRETRLCLRLR